MFVGFVFCLLVLILLITRRVCSSLLVVILLIVTPLYFSGGAEGFIAVLHDVRCYCSHPHLAHRRRRDEAAE